MQSIRAARRSSRAAVRRSRRLAMLCAAATSAAPAAFADKYWVGADGNWLDPAWSLTAGGAADQSPPAANENAFVSFNDVTTRTVNYVNPGFTDMLGALTIDNRGGGGSAISQSQDRMAAQRIVVGASGRGSYTLNGGTLATGSSTLSSPFSVGSNAGSVGTFTQNGGTATLGGNVYFGYSGNASVTLAGGTLNATNTGGVVYLGYGKGAVGSMTQTAGTFNAYRLSIGENLGSRGGYSMSGSNSLLTGDALYVGMRGTGTLSQSDGLLTFRAITVGSSGSGTYNLAGGTVSASQAINVNAGTLNQSGGSVSTMALNMGQNSGNHSNYSVSNGATLAVSSTAFIADDTATLATINQTGGSVSFGGWVYFGHAGTANYSLAGGTLSATNGMMILGFQGVGAVGNMTHTTGTFNASTLRLGFYSGSYGSYAMSNGAALNATDLQVAFGGNGLFAQTGGSTTVRGQFVVGYSGGAGTVSLSGGVLSATNSATFLSSRNGDIGTATVNHTGGTFVTKSLIMGAYELPGATAPTASYSLTGPGTLTVLADMHVGTISNIVGLNGGAATYAQSDGTATIGTTLSIGDAPTAAGTVTLSGGNLTVPQAIVGGGTNGTAGGTGRLNVSGGTFAATNLTVFSGPGSALNVSGGSLVAAATTNGGSIVHSGGSASFGPLSGTGTLSVGAASGLTARATVTSISQSSVTVNATGALAVSPNVATFTNTVNALAIAAGGRLDLANHNVVTSTAPATIRQMLANGYHGGAWDGTATAGGVGSITSVTANLASPSDARSLAYASSADVAAGSVTGGVAGQIAAGQTLVTLTVPADFNLDGKADFNDFLALQNHYNQAGDWTQGDANYDGVVDFNDFLILQNNYNHALPAAGLASSVGVVPEPGALALLALPWWLCAGRARHRRRR